MYTLKNEFLTVQANTHGAELRSIRDNRTGIEYLWQADARYWGRSAPVLFPFVGASKGGQYTVDGITYPMVQHGFARDMDFVFLSLAEEENQSTIWFSLSSTPETLKKYPFAFELRIGYHLNGRDVKVLWEVRNTENKEIYFSIGAHPAFNCPLVNEGKDTRTYFQFDMNTEIRESKLLQEIKSRRLVGGLASDIVDTYFLEQASLEIQDALFTHDALVIENHQVQSISLAGSGHKPYVTVSFDAPLVGLWSPPGKHAPFACIEPWYGRCDQVDFDGELKDREWVNRLLAGEVFRADYTIHIC